jgi:hypothetical protein
MFLAIGVASASRHWRHIELISGHARRQFSGMFDNLFEGKLKP